VTGGAVEAGGDGAGFEDDEIAGVGVGDGEAPGDAAVAADDDGVKAGEGGAGDVVAGPGEGGAIPGIGE
jgi:hypothetical protein